MQGCGDQDAAGQAVAGRDAELPTCGQQGAHGLSLAGYSHETSYQARKATVSRYFLVLFLPLNILSGSLEQSRTVL